MTSVSEERLWLIAAEVISRFLLPSKLTNEENGCKIGDNIVSSGK